MRWVACLGYVESQGKGLITRVALLIKPDRYTTRGDLTPIFYSKADYPTSLIFLFFKTISHKDLDIIHLFMFTLIIYFQIPKILLSLD